MIYLGFPADFVIHYHTQKFIFMYSFNIYIIDHYLHLCVSRDSTIPDNMNE